MASIAAGREAALEVLVKRKHHAPGNETAPDDPSPGQQNARRLTMYDDGELTELPEPEWDVPGIIPRNALVQIFGAYATYKSFIALLFAFSRQLGMDLHGRRVRAGPVFYICAEGAVGMRVRVAALRQYLGVQLAGIYFIPQSVFLNVPGEASLAVESIRERLHPDAQPWVIVDTRSRCLKGNENSTEDMSAFVRGCDMLRVQLNATVIVLHHPGWGNDARGRGAYDFDASCDTIIRVERDQERVTLTCTKMKDGPDFAPLAYEALPSGKSLVFREVELNAGKLTGQRLHALRVLHDNSTQKGWKYKAWLDATELKSSSFNKARDWLNANAYVSNREGMWKVTDAGNLALNSTHSTATPPGLHSTTNDVGQTNSTHGGVYTPGVVEYDGERP